MKTQPVLPRFLNPKKIDTLERIGRNNDGGYIITGRTNMFGNSNQAFLLKTNSNGDQEWIRSFGDSGTDGAYCVKQTTDGGFIVVGSTLIKIDSNGNKEWEQLFAGKSVQETIDGGYIITGYTDNMVYDVRNEFNIKGRIIAYLFSLPVLMRPNSKGGSAEIS